MAHGRESIHGQWSQYTLLGHNFFGLVEYVTANIMLPLGGMLIAVFVGWHMAEASSREELGLDEGLPYRVWRILVCYVTSVAIGLVLLNVTGLLPLGQG
jgi:NSS family neurotransmitter:Na+ symporter